MFLQEITSCWFTAKKLANWLSSEYISSQSEISHPYVQEFVTFWNAADGVLRKELSKKHVIEFTLSNLVFFSTQTEKCFKDIL